MIATAHATIATNGVLAEVRSEPPLTIRQIRTEQFGTCALCLVGSAAGPLAGDTRTLRVNVLPGARATITAAGAQLAQGRDADAVSTCRTELALGEQATLTGHTGPLIVAAGAATHVDVSITLAPSARLDWREIVVLGRTAEPPGRARIRWDVLRDGTPLLRHSVDLTADPGPLLAGHRVLASCLLAGPGLTARTVVRHTNAVAAKLANDAVLITVLGTDAAAATNDLQALRAALAPGAKDA